MFKNFLFTFQAKDSTKAGTASAASNMQATGKAAQAASKDYIRVTGASKASAAAAKNAASSTQALGAAFKNAAQNAALITGPLGGIASRITIIGALLSNGTLLLSGFGLALSGLTLLMVKGLKAAAAFETQQYAIEGVLKATSYSVGLTSAALLKMAENLGIATLASVQGARGAIASLLTFKSVSGGIFEDTLKLAQDLASAGFGTLEANVMQLGKALEEPIRGMNTLRRVGVSFTDAQRDVITTLTETGEVAQAQGVILEVLSSQVKGVSENVARGLAGAWDTLGERIKLFFEKVGSGANADRATMGLIRLASGVEKLTEIMTDTPLERMAALRERIDALQPSLTNMINSPLPDLFGAMENTAGRIRDLKMELDHVKRSVQEMNLDAYAAKVAGSLATASARAEGFRAAIGRVVDIMDPVRVRIRQVENAITALNTAEFIGVKIGKDDVALRARLIEKLKEYTDKLNELTPAEKKAAKAHDDATKAAIANATKVANKIVSLESQAAKAGIKSIQALSESRKLEMDNTIALLASQGATETDLIKAKAAINEKYEKQITQFNEKENAKRLKAKEKLHKDLESIRTKALKAEIQDINKVIAERSKEINHVRKMGKDRQDSELVIAKKIEAIRKRYAGGLISIEKDTFRQLEVLREADHKKIKDRLTKEGADHEQLARAILDTNVYWDGEVEKERRASNDRITADQRAASEQRQRIIEYEQVHSWGAGAQKATNDYFKSLTEHGRMAGEFMVNSVFRPMRESLSNFFLTGKLSAGNFFESLKKSAADAAADMVMSFGETLVKGILSSLLGLGGTGGGGGGGLVGGLVSGITSAIGGLFGGGGGGSGGGAGGGGLGGGIGSIGSSLATSAIGKQLGLPSALDMLGNAGSSISSLFGGGTAGTAGSIAGFGNAGGTFGSLGAAGSGNAGGTFGSLGAAGSGFMAAAGPLSAAAIALYAYQQFNRDKRGTVEQIGAYVPIAQDLEAGRSLVNSRFIQGGGPPDNLKFFLEELLHPNSNDQELTPEARQYLKQISDAISPDGKNRARVWLSELPPLIAKQREQENARDPEYYDRESYNARIAREGYGMVHGGLVSGPGGVDNVRARLTAGEFVMTKAATARMGSDTLSNLNDGRNISVVSENPDVVSAIRTGSEISSRYLIKLHAAVAAMAHELANVREDLNRLSAGGVLAGARAI